MIAEQGGTGGTCPHITSLLVSYVISLWYNHCHAHRMYVRIIIGIILVHTLKHLSVFVLVINIVHLEGP